MRMVVVGGSPCTRHISLGEGAHVAEKKRNNINLHARRSSVVKDSEDPPLSISRGTLQQDNDDDQAKQHQIKSLRAIKNLMTLQQNKILSENNQDLETLQQNKKRDSSTVGQTRRLTHWWWS